MSPASVGVLLRSLVVLEQEGATRSSVSPSSTSPT
jgi:hypothetical protein